MFRLSVFGQTHTEDAAELDPEKDEASQPIVTMEAIQVETERLETRPQYTLRGDLLRQMTGSGGDPIRGIARLPSVGTVNDSWVCFP